MKKRYKVVSVHDVGSRPRYYAAPDQIKGYFEHGPPALHERPWPFGRTTMGLQAIVEDGPLREVWYVAHPVSGNPVLNCFNAIAWLRWFAENDRSRVYVAPWIPEVLAYAGVLAEPGEPGSWEWALDGDEHVIAHLDGIVAVGGSISRGMAREMKYAREHQKYVTDMSRYRTPNDLEPGFFIEEAEYAE